VDTRIAFPTLGWRQALTIVKPGTFVRWHRQGFRLFWKWKSKPRGRPRIPAELQKLIVEMAGDNPTWGEERIAAELLLKVGIRISPRTVRRYMPKDQGPRRGPSPQHWMTFVRNHAEGILACDFFVTVTASFRVLYVFVIMEVGTRRIATSTSRLILRRAEYFSSFARSSRERNLAGSSSTTATASTLRSSIRL
jgi:putative transposase